MKIGIINRFAKTYIDYENTFNNSDDLVIFNTHKKMTLTETSKNKIYNYEGFDKSFYLDIVNEHKKQPFDKIVALSEFDIERAAELRDYLKIKGTSYQDAIIFRDKCEMKKHLSKVISVPHFSNIEKWIDILNFIDIHKFPVIIKPRLEAGSDGIVVIKNETDLRNFFKSSPNIFNMIIEKFIPHDMYHVDGFWDKDKIHSLIVFKYVNNGLAFMDNKFIGSIIINEPKIVEIFSKQITSIFSTLSVKQTLPYHAEFFMDEQNNVYLCEIAIRMGGGAIRETYQAKSGLDFLALDCKNQAYDQIQPVNLNTNLYGFLLVINKKGTLKEVPVFHSADIIKHVFNKDLIGVKFSEPESWADSYITYIVKGNNFEDIFQKMNNINNWQIENTIWEKENE